MRDFTIDNLTEIVLDDYLTNTKDPRFKEIIGKLIQHLHAFVKDVELTEAEWFQAIQFLTATGQKCDDKRQEFILLSDSLGVSMLVDAINHPKAGKGTSSTVLGPFHVDGAPSLPNGSSVIKQRTEGLEMLVRGKVTDQDGKALAGATLDIWSAAPNSFYDVQDPNAPAFNLRGKFTSGADGGYEFVTERPASYPIPIDGPVGDLFRAAGRNHMRPAHLHFIVKAAGYDTLTTHLFMPGDPYLENDAVFATKTSLVVEVNESSEAALASQYGVETPFATLDFDFGMMPRY